MHTPTFTTIREGALADVPALSRLMTASVETFIVGDASPEARDDLVASLQPASVAANMRSGVRYFVAECGGDVVGVAGVKGGSHLLHLFVDERWHRQGVGTALWEHVRAVTPLERVRTYTVYAATQAVPFYERLGFRPTDDLEPRDGVPHVPMKLTIADGANPTTHR